MKPSTTEFGPTYARLRDVLSPYVGTIVTDSVLKKVLAERGLTPSTLKESQLAEVVADAMRPLRVLIEGEKLPDLMVELAALINELEGSR